jgi:hypothetical protein
VPREVIVGDEDVHGYALVENRNALYFDFFMILWKGFDSNVYGESRKWEWKGREGNRSFRKKRKPYVK